MAERKGQGQFDTAFTARREQSDLLTAPRAAALMTMVIFRACCWKKKVTVCSKPQTNQEPLGTFTWVFSSPSDSPLSGILCSPEPMSALPGSGIRQSLRRWELNSEVFPAAKHRSYYGRLLVPTLEKLSVFWLLGNASASPGVKKERPGCPSPWPDNAWILQPRDAAV